MRLLMPRFHTSRALYTVTWAENSHPPPLNPAKSSPSLRPGLNVISHGITSLDFLHMILHVKCHTMVWQLPGTDCMTVWPLSSDSLRFYGVIQYFKETHTRIINRKNSTVLLSFRNKNLNLEQYFLIVDYFVVVSYLDSLTVLKNCHHGAIQPTSLPEKIRFLAIIIHFKYKMLQLIE